MVGLTLQKISFTIIIHNCSPTFVYIFQFCSWGMLHNLLIVVKSTQFLSHPCNICQLKAKFLYNWLHQQVSQNCQIQLSKMAPTNLNFHKTTKYRATDNDLSDKYFCSSFWCMIKVIQSDHGGFWEIIKSFDSPRRVIKSMFDQNTNLTWYKNCILLRRSF